MRQEGNRKGSRGSQRSGIGIAGPRRTSGKMTYLFSVIILAIVVITFIALPYYRHVARSSSMTFGSYNGQPIKYSPGSYFAQEQNILSQRLQGSSQNLSPQVKAYEIWRGAFERTVIHTAILQQAKRSGLYVTNHRIDKALTQYGPYVVNGKFSAAAYKQTSKRQRHQIRALFREELLGQQYQTDVFNSEKASKPERKFVEQMASPERKFEFVGYNENGYPKSQVITYGKVNKKQFRTISLSRITVKSSEQKAKTLRKRLEKNPNLFEQLAKTQSQDAFAAKGGAMGVHTYTSLKTDFENQSDLNKLFAMKKGQISGVIRAPFGWTIYRVDQAAKEPDFTNPKMIKTVRTYLQEYKQGMIENYFVARAKKFRAAAEKSGFAAEASADNLPVHSSKFFPINYGNAAPLPTIHGTGKGPSLAPAAQKSKSLKQLFSLKIGSISKPMILGNYVLVVTPTAQRAAPKSFSQRISNIYSLLVSRFTQQELYHQILSSNKLHDNFRQVFERNFNFSSSQAGSPPPSSTNG